ncbi:response regulator [Thermodesulfobacteriota bacterium]
MQDTWIFKKRIDWVIIRKDGNGRNVEASISLIGDPDSGGRPIGFRGILRDITDRKVAEEALQESEERFRFLVEESPLGICLTDKLNANKYINPRFIQIFGYALEEIPIGKNWFRKAFPDKKYRSSVIKHWLNGLKNNGVGEARPQTYDVCCKDGSIKVIHFRPVKMEAGEQITFCEDITDRKNLEAQLLQAQKMESLSTLAGGMAHNFNNLLMGIQGNSSLILSETKDSHPHFKRLRNIDKLVQSGSKLTHQLLGYARKGSHEVNSISLNQLVTETSETFGMARKEIRIRRELSDNGSRIIADQSQIEQVLLNLYVNAADAMPNGGDLFLETRDVKAENLTDKPYKIKPGKYVLLSVSDTGMGMDRKTKECIFDPFFTTKGLGKGTGLGLASVYGIIKAHGGYIDVDSKKGYGTEIYIYLPKSEKALDIVLKKPSKIVKGKGTILIVDDESLVLEVVVEYLRSLEYNVLHAKGGNEAITIYKEKKEDIDLVILDLIMPDMGGGEAFDTMKSINPDIKVLLSSGYSVDGRATEILKRGCNSFIQKPFDMETLSQSINEVLNT